MNSAAARVDVIAGREIKAEERLESTGNQKLLRLRKCRQGRHEGVAMKGQARFWTDWFSKKGTGYKRDRLQLGPTN